MNGKVAIAVLRSGWAQVGALRILRSAVRWPNSGEKTAESELAYRKVAERATCGMRMAVELLLLLGS